MLNLAIIEKTIRDSGLTLCLAAIGLVGFVILIVFSMLNVGAEAMEFISKIGFIRKIFEATLGIDVEGDVSVKILVAVAFTHGMVLMLTWGTLIAGATRVNVGEIEKGTSELLLTLPVTRTQVYFSTSIALLVAIVVLSICPFVGVMIGCQIFETKEVVELSHYIAPSVNFLAINLAVTGLACLVSCLMSRRAPAVGIIVAIAFISVVLNFVEPFVPESIKPIRYLGLLNYFRPVDIVRTGEWPFGSIGVLVTLATVCWAIGWRLFRSKDIPTA